MQGNSVTLIFFKSLNFFYGRPFGLYALGVKKCSYATAYVYNLVVYILA
jgi:hypothetical protein